MAQTHKRWRALEAEMKTFTLGSLMPTCTCVARTSGAGAHILEQAVAYALGLQGDIHEARSLAALIEHVHQTDDSNVYVAIEGRPASEEEIDNLLQAFGDVMGLPPAKVCVTATDSAIWHHRKPK